jgi:transposase
VKGYERLLCWAEGFGPVRCAGVEATSSYGAGLARHLKARGIEVLEVEHPKRQRRSPRRNVKSDPSDAERAARAGRRPAKRGACPRALTVVCR